MSTKVLFVDDDANVLSSFQRSLRKKFDLETALGPAAALAAIASRGPFAVIVADMQMPGMNGVELLTKVQEIAPDTVRLMLTGNAEQKTAIQAVNQGHVFRFLTKPCPPETLILAIEAALHQHRLIVAERELLEKTLNGSIKLLTDILSMTDSRSFGRGQQLCTYVRMFAAHFKIAQSWDLELAAMLAPIGFVALPNSLVTRMTDGLTLNGAERDILARVPEIGANLLTNIPRLESVGAIVRYQNKNFDGSGFPTDTVAGDEIPIGSRILRVLSDLLILESHKMAKFKALETLRQRPGRYDPKVLKAVAACFDISPLPQNTSEPVPQAVVFNELRIGQRLAAGVQTTEGTLIVSAGTEVTQMVLEKLRNFHELSGVQQPLYVFTSAAA